jgi:Tol biopolymer transport system component
MPDFDTRTPQKPNEPSRHRTASIADKLRALLVAARSRVPSIANRVRSLLSATTLRALLIGGGILFFVAIAVPVGLLIYPSGGRGDQQVAEVHSSGGIGDQQWEAKNANLEPLAACSSNGGGQEREVLDDGSNAKKIVFASGPQTTASSSGTMSDIPGHPGTGMYVINADGSGLTQLTRTTAAEFGIPDSLVLGDSEIESIISHDSSVTASADPGDPTGCSPDRKKLASVTTTAPEATDSDSSAPPDDTDISVRTSAGTTDLGDPDYDYSKESAPIFSPDSRKLAFTKGEQIYMANADGSGQARLVDKMRYTAGPIFSPDSEKIAFVTDTPGGPDSEDLYVINTNGTNLTRLTHNTKRFGKGYSIQEHIHGGGGVLFSPDSKKIAFVLYRIKYTPYTPSGHRDVKLPIRYDMYVVNVDGTGLTRLTHTEALEERIVTWAGR